MKEKGCFDFICRRDRRKSKQPFVMLCVLSTIIILAAALAGSTGCRCGGTAAKSSFAKFCR